MSILSRIKKSHKKVTDETRLFIVPGKSGEPFLDFPDEVISGLRHMVTRLHQREGLPRRLSLVAALRYEGVSYISRALSAVIAHDLALRICLVDLNLWWPDSIFSSQVNLPTLADVIAGQTTLDKALLFSGWPNLAYLPAGEIPRQRRPMVAHSQSLKGIIEELTERFDHLILDIPAILATHDSVALASLGTAACLVIHQGVTHTEDVKQAVDEIEHLNIVGVIMNRMRLNTPSQLVKMISS